MTTLPTTPARAANTGDARNKGRTPRRTQLLSVTYVGTMPGTGRRILHALYPSSRDGIPAHVLTVLDDGRVLDCACDAGKRQVHCWHVETADAVVVAYHTALWFVRSPTERDNWEQHLRAYLDMPLDESDRSAALLELQAVCQVGKQRREVAA